MSPSASSPSSFRATTGPPALWLCLRFELLALESLREADRLPDFVYWQHRLIAVAPRASSQGLYRGMSVNQALMMAPGSRGRERDPAREQQQLQALAHWAYRYTPQVSIGDQCLLLEVGHCLTLFKGFDALWHLLERDLAAFSVSVQPGVAHTPAAARVLSFALDNGVRAAREGITDPETFLLLLGQAAIDTLAIDAQVAGRLQGCGFEVLEELLAAPREEIGQRFGREFMDYLARLLGEKEDPQALVVPPEPFLLVQDFAEPIHNTQWIAQCIDEMLRQLCEFLRRRQWRCQLLVWRFYGDKTLIESVSIPLSSRYLSSGGGGFETFKKLTDLHLEKLRLGGELMRIELFSDKLLPAQLLVEDFFDPRIREQEAAELVDRLAARLGSDAVYRLAAVAEPVPELSVARVPFADTGATGNCPASILPAADRVSSPKEFQPLWLLVEPQLLPATSGNSPQPLDKRGRPIVLIQGPDRIDSHWWQPVPSTTATGGGYHRDYYIARQRNGRVLWVFHDRILKQWFLHGLFG